MQFFHAVIVSFILHLAIVSFLDKIPRPAPREKVVIELVEETKDESRPKQLVRQATPPEKVEERPDPKKARFKSERDQTVREETRANRTGMTQNEATPPRRAGRKSSPDLIAKKFAPVFTGNPKPQPMKLPATGESLPKDIKMGQFNALNTERFLYYSFFSRIEERVRGRWEPYLKDIFRSVDPRELRRGQWMIQLDVQLDRAGNYLDTVIHTKSGIPEFDALTVRAFRESAPFQNPPQEMIEKDGKIHLRYTITVNLEA